MDARKKKVLAVLVCGSVILVWRVVAVVNKYLPSSAAATTVVAPALPTGELTPALAARNVEMVVCKQQNEVALQPWGRDPFSDVPGLRQASEPKNEARNERPSLTPPTPPQVVFTGVCRRGERWMTLLDGKILTVGDNVVDGFNVVEIDKQSVTLGSGSWLYRYDLGVQEAVIRPRAEEP